MSNKRQFNSRSITLPYPEIYRYYEGLDTTKFTKLSGQVVNTPNNQLLENDKVLVNGVNSINTELQDHLNEYKESIGGIVDTLEDLLEKYQDLLDRLNGLDGLLDPYSGFNGQILYKDSNSSDRRQVSTRDQILFKKVATNPTELTQLKIDLSGLKEVFDTWEKMYINWKYTPPMNNSSDTEGIHYANAWSFDPSTVSIKCSENRSSYGLFVSPNKFSDWSLTLEGTGDGDDDGLLILIGLAYDTNGYPHTLSLMRSGGTNVTKSLYALVFDISYQLGIYNSVGLVNRNTEIFNYYGKTDNGNSNIYKWSDYPQRLQVIRNGKTITCRTSDNRLNNPDKELSSRSEFIIEYTLPSTQPSNLNSTQWRALQDILNNPSQIGVGVISNKASFKIIESENIFSDPKIYDTMNNEVLEYDGANWVNIGTIPEFIPNRVTIYSSPTKKLLYWDGSTITNLAT